MPDLSTWILVSNASEAFLYNSNNLRTNDLNFVKQFSHPESRMKAIDLVTDDKGSFTTDSTAHSGSHGSYEKGDPKKVEAETFALILAKELHAHCNSEKECNKLIIVGPTHFCGLMKKHLKTHVTDLTYIAKDYTKYTSRELLEALRSHLYSE